MIRRRHACHYKFEKEYELCLLPPRYFTGALQKLSKMFLAFGVSA
jgi:hypothetical protein